MIHAEKSSRISLRAIAVVAPSSIKSISRNQRYRTISKCLVNPVWRPLRNGGYGVRITSTVIQLIRWYPICKTWKLRLSAMSEERVWCRMHISIRHAHQWSNGWKRTQWLSRNRDQADAPVIHPFLYIIQHKEKIMHIYDLMGLDSDKKPVPMET